MPPQSKKKYRTAILPPLGEPQDYTDPLKKLALNPGQTTAEKVVTAAGKRPVAKPRARVSKVARKLADQPAMQAADPANPFDWRARRVYAFIENARMTPAELADYRLRDEREAEARRFEELTTVPDITLSATGAIQPGSGLVLSSMMRYGYQALNNSLALTGQVLQDAFGSDDMPTVLGSLGQALSNIAKESAPTFENYDIARPVKERGALDRTVGFLTQLGIQLPQMAVATELLGPAAGFGVYKAESLHAAGEQDAATLAGAFVQGAAEGMLLSALGKTANVLQKTPRTGPVVDLLKKSPVAAQAGAQLVGGMAQTGVDGMLHPGQPAPDWLDYLHGGVANVIMDPVVLGGSGRSRKATQAATRMSGELDPSSYNLDLPPDNLAALRQDFWQPKDLPWDNHTVTGLLNRSRVQYADNPADPEGVLYLNPQAAAVVDRASQAVLPGSKIMSGVAQGMSLPARDAGLVAEHLLEKAAQFKETIKQLPDGDPKLNDLATGAVVFESLAEHLQAATADGQRSAALRVLNKQKATDPANPVARAFDQTVIGHESIHVQTDKIAKEMGVDPRAMVSPGWLADHPIGAKVILGIGDSKSPLQGYDPVEWTNEAIAYAAQPGPDPGLGLTKQERGVLVGDYFAAVMDKHGPQVMDQVWVGRMDREVAQVAFKRLYESNRVRYSRDPVSGRRLGLEWRGVQDPLPITTERVPDNGWGEVRYANRQEDLDYETVPPFYSGLERFIQRKVVGKVLPATQLISQLKNAGLRPGELEWTGVMDWLGEKAGADGKGKVGKDELLQELASRRVEVREVWKGADPDNDPLKQTEFPKYQSYIQPGESSNYRELLLTLPAKGADLVVENINGKYFVLNNSGPEQTIVGIDDGWRGYATEAEAQAALNNFKYSKRLSSNDDYRSSHWSEPNILAHVRMTDRIGSQGEKVLFIEEVQSDWHQAGAKVGYGDQPKKSAELERLQELWDEVDTRLTEVREQLDQERSGQSNYSLTTPTANLAATLRDQLRSIERRMARVNVETVPDAPFKKTWPELAMRRMIRYAAEKGYDRVAWVRGEDADRSVGGSSSWFYDRNLINTTNNILKKFGSSVVTAKDPVINDKPKVQYVPATRVGWSRDAEGLISLYPIIDGQVRYGGQYNNLTLEDLRLTVDADAYNQVAAAVSSDTHQFAGNPQFDTMVASGVIEGGEAGIGIANDNWRTQVMAAETAGASLAESRHSFEITPAMREGVLYQGQPIPLNIQPDPDYDAANPAGEAADEAAGKLELDPDITHLRKTNAPPEISQQVAAQREAERKAYREVANLRARIKRNNDLAAAATKMQQDAGLPQPELDAEIQQLGTELKQQHVEAVKKFRELRSRGNVLKGQLAGQLSDNVQAKRTAAKLAARGRLANGDELPPLDSPLEQTLLSNEYSEFLHNLAKDMLIASDIPLLPSSEMQTTDQLLNAMRLGRTNYDTLNEVVKRYGLKNVPELFARFRQSNSAAARVMNQASQVQREINKLLGIHPELDEWILQQPPTMQEIDAIANGPSIARQLVNLNIGATIAQLATQTPNVVTGLVNATGVRSIINLADQVIERAIGSKRELTGGPGEPSKFEQNSVPPLSTVLAPVFAASTATKDILNNPYWFAHGKLKDGTLNDPADRPAEKSIRIAQELHNFQPELMRKFDSQLSDDVIQIHLLPHADAVQAERDALTLLKNQVTNMPAGADKFARLARIKEAEARLAKSDRWLPKVLHEASRGLHKYLTLARMGERFVRTISLVSNLETEAARYGLDLEQLDTANEIHKLPAAVVERAVNQALQDTYATRPEPGSLTAQAYNWYAKSNDPAAVLTSAVFPFVGFMGNYAKMVLDYSPLPIIKAALVGAGESGPTVENHQKLIKATLGTAVYVAVAAMIEDKYEEAERTGKPVSSWHSIGGVSVRNVPQLVAPLYVADYIARQRRGLAAPEADSALEFFNILVGLDMRNITGTFKWLDDLVTAAQDQSGNKGTKAAEAAATAFSDWFGRYLTPLNMYTDIGAQYFTSMRDVKDLYGMGAGSLFAPILNRIPVAREQLSDKIDPYTGMPVHRTDLPAIKAITGFTVLPEQSYPARIFQHAGIKLTDWIPFTGVTEVDRDLVATIGRMMKERTADLEATQQHMDIDQKIVDTYDVARAVADDAFEEVLSRYPEVERKLEDAGEFNRWERRVEDKERKRSGRPSLAEEQLQLMQQRKAAAGSK